MYIYIQIRREKHECSPRSYQKQIVCLCGTVNPQVKCINSNHQVDFLAKENKGKATMVLGPTLAICLNLIQQSPGMQHLLPR